jgi:Short C-terminal domain
MNTVARNEVLRTPVFNAVSAGLLLLSVAMVMLNVVSPPSPLDMMVPWLRSVNLLQALLGAACVTLIWLRKGWAFYVYVGVILLGVLVALLVRYPIPLVLVGPALLALYLWALHSGGASSMWIQMFGRAGVPGRSMAYGITPAMPPQMPTVPSPPRPPSHNAAPAATAATPPLPPSAHVAPPAASPAAPAAAPTAAPPRASVDPLEALKRLGALRDSGAITEAEFAAKKAELLQRL